MIGRNKVRAVQDAVTLQYANGKSVARRTLGTGRFAPYVGFHIEAGRDGELDAVLQQAKVAQCEIKHQRPGGAEVVRHWDFGETVRLFPVTSGPVAPTVAGSLAGGNARETAEAGLGLRWGNGERSKLAVRAYLEPLVKVGYLRLVQLSVRSRMTDELLKALLDHGRMCEAADSLIDRTRHPELVTFHELALPLGAGNEQEWGKGDTATVVPFVSRHAQTLNAELLRELWRPDELHAAALREWEGIQQWAREYAAQAEESAQRPAEEPVVGAVYEEAL
jgi:hypothetical protein